jgi:hypothetical protein
VHLLLAHDDDHILHRTVYGSWVRVGVGAPRWDTAVGQAIMVEAYDD